MKQSLLSITFSLRASTFRQIKGAISVIRLTSILLLTIINISVSGQGLAGRYKAYYGHSLELKDDSTFTYEWHFDLASSWAVGQWTVSNKTIQLDFKEIYDTLTEEGKPDTLVLSANATSNKIKSVDFLRYQISGGRQVQNPIVNKLAIRGKRLYLTDKRGRILRTRTSGIWAKKKRPTYYFKVD